MLDAQRIAALQERLTLEWHRSPETGVPATALEHLVLGQHRANFDLWHREDEARDPGASVAAIAAVKHAIDTLNQQRNDLVEQIDLLLLENLQQNPSAPLNSETPGLMIDRLSILALKLFHTSEETVRHGAPAAHHQRNRDRLHVLWEQRTDLTLCLGELWTEIGSGRRRFKLYRQLKMYNDPTLNPVLYGAVQPVSPGSPKPR